MHRLLTLLPPSTPISPSKTPEHIDNLLKHCTATGASAKEPKHVRARMYFMKEHLFWASWPECQQRSTGTSKASLSTPLLSEYKPGLAVSEGQASPVPVHLLQTAKHVLQMFLPGQSHGDHLLQDEFQTPH
jgi:hypothetical protein